MKFIELAQSFRAKIVLVHAASKSRDVPLVFNLTGSQKYSKVELDKLKLAAKIFFRCKLEFAKKERSPWVLVGSQGKSTHSRHVVTYDP